MNSLQRLHQELYHREWNQALPERQNNSAELEKYENNFTQELREASTTSVDSIVQALCHADILMYGDFHTSRASVDGCRDILCRMQERRQLVLCLELFRAQDQSFVDAYLYGHMTEFEFLEAIQYESEWGFPWKHYKDLLKTAKDLGVKVFGIDTHRKGCDQLQKRDQFMAQKLVSLKQQDPEPLYVCVVGENHIAKPHLPDLLKKIGGNELCIIRLANNIDQYFFKCLEKKTKFPVYLSISKSFFCVMNTTPWSKWKSFNMWSDLKASFNDRLDEQIGEYNEMRIDLDYHFYELCHDLSGFIGLKIPQQSMQRFSIDESSFQGLSELKSRDTSLRSGFGLYDLEKYTVYFNEHWQDAFPYLAGQFLYHTLHPGFDFKGDDSFVFLKHVLWHAIGTMCAKIFDPHFSAMSLDDHDKYVEMTSDESHQVFVSNTVLKFVESLTSPEDMNIFLEGVSQKHSLELSTICGQSLGAQFLSEYPLLHDEVHTIASLFCHDDIDMKSLHMHLKSLIKKDNRIDCRRVA